MTSEIRANIIKNRVGLGTIEYSNTGPVISGVTTASNFKTGTSNLHSTGLNIQDLDVDGHTNLDNVSIAGVSTFSGNVTISKQNAVIELSDPDSSDANYQIRNDNGTFDIKDSTNSTVKIRAAGSYVTVFPNLNANNGLDVMGTITGDGNLDIADSVRHSGDINTKITFPANDTISFDTAGSERLRINSNGNIGINSTSPANKLDVALGAAWIYPDDDGTEAIALKLGKLKDYNTSFNDILVADNDNSTTPTYQVTNKINRYLANWHFDRVTSPGATRLNAFRLRSALEGANLGNKFTIRDLRDTADSVVLWSNGNSYVGVTTDGTSRNFGIGTNNPSAVLHVEKNGTNQVLARFESNLGTNNNRAITLTSPETDSTNNYFTFATGNAFKFKVDTINALCIASDGEIGIGIDNPQYKLHVGGNIRTTGDLYVDNNFGVGTDSPIVRLHVHNSGTGAGDHAYAHFTTGDTGSTISDGLTVGVAANQVASVNYREAGTLSLNTQSTPRITILSNGNVGINQSSPATQFVVTQDGLDDNTYSFSTEYRSGSNASGYTASGIKINSKANNSNGEDHTAYIQFDNRTAAQNGAHGVAAFITLTTPDAQGTYGTGEFNFYCRNAAAYSFPNDPAVSSSYWMSSLFKIKSTGELFGYGNLRIDTGSNADGIIGAAYGTSYFGMKQADQGASEYMMISNNNHTYISCTSGYSIYIRPSANSQTHETLFAHDNTTFKTNVVLDNHQLRRNQHNKGHMEGGHNNIGSSNVKTSPIYTIGSAYNPNENDLNNMYGIGYCHSDASFINSNVTGGWGQYVASDGDARIFLNAGDGVVYANRYGRVAHNSGHLQGSYNNVGANSAQSNPIYTIGSSYNPAASTLSNMYGVGFSHGNNASFLSFSGLTGWGLYVAADGDARMFLDASTGKIAATGTITGSASDVRLKTNIKVIDNPIEKIKKIRGVTFDWVDNITSEYDFHPDSMHETGVIAQEIQEVIPDAVATAPFNGNYTRKSGTDNNYLTVKNEKIIPLCIEAIKKLTAKVESLEQENTALKARVTSLEE